MPFHRRQCLGGLAVAAAFVLAGCNSGTAPQTQLPDPQGLSNDLATVAGVLASSPFQSFSAMSAASGSPAAAPTRAGALLRAAPIVSPSTSDAPYANAAARFAALRSSAARLASGISRSVVPPALLGQTFTWDVATHAYIENASYTPTAPSDRVRIILYDVYPDGKIIEGPLTVVGYADLVDESTTAPAVNKLHVIVAAGSPATPGATYVDYTVSGSVTGSPPTAFTATAAGFVTDLTRTLTFNATFAVTNVDTDNPDGQIDATWDLDNPAIHIELHETIATPNANEIDVTLTDFSFTRGTQKVSEHGSLSIVASPQTVTVNLAIDVNGELWARFSGTNQALDVRHAGGTKLSDVELVAFTYLYPLPDTIAAAIQSMFAPCENLMGA